MDHRCFTNNENSYNFDLVVFAHGRVIENDESAHFECPSPKFFRIPHNCTFSHLKEKVCDALGLQDKTLLMNLYCRRPQQTTQGQTRYNVVQIITDENVSELLTWKSQFPFPTMIEVYVKLTRSAEEILRLLNALTASNSTSIQDSITSTKAIIYCGGPIQRATIIGSRNGYGLTYICVNPKRMSIPHNSSFNQLCHNISEIRQYGDRKQVT